MTVEELQEINDLKHQIENLRNQFTFIESSCPYDKKYDGRLFHGKLALCKVFSANSIKNSVIVEFDEEMKIAVLQVLNRRLSILENKFNNLIVRNERG